MLNSHNNQKLINLNAVKKQLDMLNYRYPSIENNIINNDAMLDIYANKHIESINNFKEDLYIQCRNRLWQPFTYIKNSDTAKFVYDEKKVKKKCKGETPSVVHFHGIYPGYPSDADRYAHKEFFKSGFEFGAVVGIDGIHVQTPQGHFIRLPWSEKMNEKLISKGKNVISNVKTITCNRLDSKNDLRECTIYLADGLGSITNIFSKVNWEEPMVNQSFYPYRSIDNSNSDMTSHVDFNATKSTCVITKHKNKRFLSCFRKES